MQRYKIYPLHEREFVRVSFIPKELEIIWSIVLSIWFAVVLSKDCVINSYSFWSNLANIIFLITLVSVYFCLIAIGFSKGFKTGSIKAYTGIIFLTIMTSLILLNNYLTSLESDTLRIFLTFSTKLKIVFIFIIIPFFVCFLQLVSYRWYQSLKKLGKVDNIELRERILYRLGALFFINTATVLLLFYNWKFFFEWTGLQSILTFIAGNTKGYDKEIYNIFMIIIINLLVFLRIIGTEIIYLKNTMQLRYNLGRKIFH